MRALTDRSKLRLVKSETHDYDPQWSPDGKRLVYYAEKGDRRDQVWRGQRRRLEPDAPDRRRSATTFSFMVA